MTGLYLHIPFCRKACHYCDFYFSTRLENRDAIVNAMVRELEIRLSDPENQQLSSLYFGGGTPSLLSASQMERLLNSIHRLARPESNAEITLEANPEDINPEKLRFWKSMGINRLSIGLQSSHNERLTWMNRSHSVEEGERAVKMAQDADFGNITVDLMYGFPEGTQKELAEDLNYILSLDTPHISAYNLTIEPDTVFGRHKKKGQLIPLPEEDSAARFLQVFDWLEDAGYSAYEISNFAKPGAEAHHNRNYWLQKAFIGIGPSAHGFDGKSQRWENTASNASYLRDLDAGKLSETVEILSQASLANEFILTRLRMREGLPLPEFREKFGISLEGIRSAEIQKAKDLGWLSSEEGQLVLCRSGRLMADFLAMEFFTEDHDFGNLSPGHQRTLQ